MIGSCCVYRCFRCRNQGGQHRPGVCLKPLQGLAIVTILWKILAAMIRHPQFPETRPAHKAKMNCVWLENAHRGLNRTKLGRNMAASGWRYSDVPVNAFHAPTSGVNCCECRISRQRDWVEKHDSAWHIKDADARQRIAKLSVIVLGITIRKFWGNLAFHRAVRHGHKPALRDHKRHAPVTQELCRLLVGQSESEMPVVVIDLHAEGVCPLRRH